MLFITSCEKSEKKTILFNEIESKIIIKPTEKDDSTVNQQLYTDNYLFQIEENRNGEIIKLLNKFFVLNPKYCAPVQKISENEFIIAINGWNDNAITYKPGIDSYEELEYRFDPDSEGGHWLFLYVNRQNNLLSFIDSLYLLDWRNWGAYFNIGYQTYKDEKIFIADVVEVTEENHPVMNDKITVNRTNGRTADFSLIKEIYSKQIMSGSKNFVYYDFIDMDYIPKIYKSNYDYRDKSIKELYKKNARFPVVSNDDSIFIYQYSANASFEPDCKWVTKIEKNGKVVKSFNRELIAIIDDDDNELYLIDDKALSVEILDLKNFQIKERGQIDKDFYFPYIYNGKLQYTCPKYEGSNIVDYVIKSEK